MSMAAPSCERCQTRYGADDRYCPDCGYAVGGELLPVAAAVAITPWRGAVPGLVQGMALAGAGVALRYVAPRAVGFAVRRTLGRRARPPVEYVEETHIVRRVWLRR